MRWPGAISANPTRDNDGSMLDSAETALDSRTMWPARAFYFFFYAAASTLLPFLTLYYASLGLSAAQIGLTAGLMPLVTLVAASAWGALADATQRHRRLLLLTCLGTWLAVFALARATPLVPLILAASLFAFFNAPIIPLVDNSVLTALHDRRDEYGVQRLWGSLGWSLTAVVAGALIQRRGLSVIFPLYLLVFVGAGVAAWRLNVSPITLGGAFFGQISRLLNDRRWWFLLGVALVNGLTLAVFGNYLFLYLDTLHISRTVMGVSLTLATISEVPIFWLGRHWLKRGSLWFILAAGLLLMTIRAFAYVAVPEVWWVLLVSLLHGPSYSLMWSAAVMLAADLAPPGLGATAQGVLNGVTFGLGAAIGAAGGGLLYAWAGPRVVFHTAGWACLAMLAILAWRRRLLAA